MTPLRTELLMLVTPQVSVRRASSLDGDQFDRHPGVIILMLSDVNPFLGSLMIYKVGLYDRKLKMFELCWKVSAVCCCLNFVQVRFYRRNMSQKPGGAAVC